MRALAMLATALVAQALAAGNLEISGDGWHSWRISTHEGMKNRCCFSWNAGQAAGTDCDLDGRRSGFSISDSSPGHSAIDEMQIYALLENGKPRKIRALSPDCPVRTESDIRNLGLVDSRASFEWLRAYASPHSELTDDVLTAISTHEGPEVRDELLRIAMNDRNSDSREAAVFALSQLPAEQAVDLLIKVVEQRSLDFDTRRNALFWLAQTDSDRVVDYFSRLLAAN